MADTVKNDTMLMYRGKPLVRKGNTVYYGYPDEPYVAMLLILSAAPVEGLSTASRVMVQLLSTDETKKPAERIIKKAEKNGLHEGLHIASIWLERSLSEEK